MPLQTTRDNGAWIEFLSHSQQDPDGARRRLDNYLNERNPGSATSEDGKSAEEIAVEHIVYMGQDGYVGITDDLDRRRKQWAAEGRTIHPIFTVPDEETARGVEQRLIEEGRARGNKVNLMQNNSINPKRMDAKAQRMRQKGNEFLDQQRKAYQQSKQSAPTSSSE